MKVTVSMGVSDITTATATAHSESIEDAIAEAIRDCVRMMADDCYIDCDLLALKIRNVDLVESVLIGGPQDGATVKAVGRSLPKDLYVGPRHMGDGYAAWGREASARFPMHYRLAGSIYQFQGNAQD